jgi:hypothetical protein
MNTGVRPGWTPSQTTNGNLTVTTNGAVIDGMLVTGSILVRAQNVTVKNTWVYGQIYNQVSGQGYNGLLIQDTDVGPPSGVSSLSDGAIGVGGFTALRVHIHNAEEGFRVGGYGSSGNKLGPVDIEDSFVELAKGACSHNDGIQGYDEPTRTTIRHNTIDTRASGPDCTTGAIFIGNGGADLITIQNNLLLGGGYSLRMGPGGTYDHVTGNRIVNGTWGYGPALVSSCGAVQQWADNSIVTIDANYQVAGTVRALNTC